MDKNKIVYKGVIKQKYYSQLSSLLLLNETYWIRQKATPNVAKMYLQKARRGKYSYPNENYISRDHFLARKV